MSEELIVKKLDSSFVKAVLSLWDRSELPYKPRGRDEASLVARRIDEGRDCFYGAFAGNDLVGVVLVTHDGRKGWINRLAVDPSRRRRGIARLLIARAEKHLEDEGIEIFAVLIEDYNTPSLELFKSCDYVFHDDIHYLSKRKHPDV
jgi:ribosomal protein S18 acetylase RimI-like enzyme